MGRKRDKLLGSRRRQVLQLEDTDGRESFLAQYGYNSRYGDEEEEEMQNNDPIFRQSNDQEEEPMNVDSDPDSGYKKGQDGPGNGKSSSPGEGKQIDSELANFMAEIEAISTVTPSDDGDKEDEKKEEEPKKKPSKENKKEKQRSESHKTENDTILLDAPVTDWQQCLDDNTECYYYWNTITNEVTWEIPPEFTQYLLQMKAFEEKVLVLEQSGKKVKISGQSDEGNKEDEKNEKKSSAYGPFLPQEEKVKDKVKDEERKSVPKTKGSHGVGLAGAKLLSADYYDSEEGSEDEEKITSQPAEEEEEIDFDIDDIDRELELALERKQGNEKPSSKPTDDQKPEVCEPMETKALPLVEVPLPSESLVPEVPLKKAKTETSETTVKIDSLKSSSTVDKDDNEVNLVYKKLIEVKNERSSERSYDKSSVRKEKSSEERSEKKSSREERKSSKDDKRSDRKSERREKSEHKEKKRKDERKEEKRSRHKHRSEEGRQDSKRSLSREKDTNERSHRKRSKHKHKEKTPVINSVITCLQEEPEEINPSTPPLDIDVPLPSNLPEHQTTDPAVAQTTDLASAQITDLPTPQTTDLPTPQNTDLPTPQTTDLATPQTTDLPTPQTTDLATAQTTDLPMPQTTDLPTSQTADLPTSQTADLASARTTDLATAQTTDLATAPVPAPMTAIAALTTASTLADTTPTVPVTTAICDSKKDKLDRSLKKTIKEVSEVVLGKLQFLEIVKDGLSGLQVLLISLQTRLEDWEAGGLTSDYFMIKLEEASKQLVQYEESAAPPGWSTHWDRSFRRYFYTNLSTGDSQWDYPDLDVKDEPEEKIDEVAPSLPSSTLQPPPPPPDDNDSGASNHHDKQTSGKSDITHDKSSRGEKLPTLVHPGEPPPPGLEDGMEIPAADGRVMNLSPAHSIEMEEMEDVSEPISSSVSSTIISRPPLLLSAGNSPLSSTPEERPVASKPMEVIETEKKDSDPGFDSTEVITSKESVNHHKEKKKKKDKISSSSLSLKKKKVSSLVQKWQQVQQEVERESSKDRDSYHHRYSP